MWRSALGTYYALVLNLCSIRPKPRYDAYVLGLSRIRTMAAWQAKDCCLAGKSRSFLLLSNRRVGNYSKCRVTVAGGDDFSCQIGDCALIPVRRMS